jgi:hypothetical protein
LDIVTVDEIIGSMDGTSPKEGVGKESSLDLKRLCRALVEMLLQDAKARMAVLPPGRLRRARHRAKRLALRTMGARWACKDAAVMMAGFQMVDIALRRKAQAGGKPEAGG